MQVYIDRQVIIDRDQKILGYTLHFQHAAHASPPPGNEDVMAAARLTASLLTQEGTAWQLGDNLVVISVTPAMLQSEFIELLPPAHVVLEIRDITPAHHARCQQLRQQGFALALNELRPSLDNLPLMELADYINFNVNNQDMALLESMVKLLSRREIKLIAQNVDTPAALHACQQAGFHYFQGQHFARPETLAERSIDPVYSHVIELLNLVRTNAETAAIEAVIKRDVMLPARLFQYVNSAAFGAWRPVYSIRQALALMGYRQLYRWLSLLTVSAAGAATPPALARTALIRAQQMELLGQHKMAGNERDNLFIVGLFSLLDVILGIPMPQVLAMLNPPDIIAEALLHRSGAYGNWLALVEACESTDAARIDTLAQAIGLSAGQINDALLGALVWVEAQDKS